MGEYLSQNIFANVLALFFLQNSNTTRCYCAVMTDQLISSVKDEINVLKGEKKRKLNL